MTLSDLIASAATRLTQAGVSFGHGTTNAHDEATWLTLWRLGLPLDTDPVQATATLDAAACQRVNELIDERIRSRKPAAYLTREAWLQGFSFYVDERVIVPRSLIAELLVDGGFDYFLRPDTHRVLDLCTGNGSLGIIAAQVFPDIQVTGADLSSDALAVAAINIERHGLQARMSLCQSDGLNDPALQACGPFDLILCNPPYVNADSMAQLPPEFQAEPEMALSGNYAGGHDGMDFIRPLLQAAPQHMTEHAVLVLEIGHERSYFEAAFPTLEAVWLPTSAGEDQVLLLTRTSLTEWQAV